MFTSDLLLGVQLWLVTFVFGIISLPFATKVFPNLFDKGYFLGKLFALFIVSYSLFLLSTLKILPLGFNSLIFLTLVWAVVNLFIYLKTKKEAIPWKRVVLEEIIFLIPFILFIFVKGHQPEIYQIERFMDFGFIKALTQSQSLPLEDIWRAGKPLNYYYFGHFLAYVLITLSKIGAIAGFFLVQCWLFATCGVVAFVAGSSILKNWNLTVKWAVFGGLLSLFTVVFAGDWQSAVWFVSNLKFENMTIFMGDLSFWYPDPTRIIPGTISEIPIYSFIVADLHAHVWGFLLGAVIITVLTSLWYQQKAKLIVSGIVCLSFLLGLSVMTNTWDFLTLGSIVFLVLFFKLKPLKDLKQLLIIFSCFAGGILVSLPWLFFFKSPLGGIGFVTSWSPPGAWILFWGPSVFLIFFYFLTKIKHKVNFDKEGLILILFFLSIFWLAFLEVIYMKDILSGGEWFRANTYFKVSLQVLLWVGIVTGPAIFAIISKTNGLVKKITCVVLVLWLLSRAVYPIKAIYQSSIEGKKYQGISTGLKFWEYRYPNDYEAFKFLQNQEKGVIVEADGDSYQDTNFFSSILGWPTIAGWPVHEWTWQGSYDEVGKRSGEVREIYTGIDVNKTKEILKTYKVKYIIIGATEHRKYIDSLNLKKLNALGKQIYEKPGVKILKVEN